jgi:hypothetical protein
MPALATLSSFGFTFVTTLISRRFTAAGLAMFVTGVLMAKFREYQFMIYGAGWLVVLESLSAVLLLRKRKGSEVSRGPGSLTLRPAIFSCPEPIKLPTP